MGGSYIYSPDWIKHKKAVINSKNKNDKCFQFAATVALNYGQIKWNTERGIIYPLKIEDWKKIESNNLTTALNVLYQKEM